MTDPDMGSWTYGYDNAGNLTSQRDGANRWLYLEYDTLNRLTKKRQDSTSGTLLAEWLYDAAGQLGLPSKSKAYSSQGTTEAYTVAYDVLNRPLQQQYTVPGAGGGDLPPRHHLHHRGPARHAALPRRQRGPAGRSRHVRL